MARLGAQWRVRERIEGLGAQCLDSTVLRERVLEVLRDAIGFDAYVWLLTDPVSAVGVAPIADVGPLPLAAAPTLIRAKYATRDKRWTVLMDGDAPVGLLDLGDAAEPAARTPWGELLSGHGIGAVASTVFADQHGCWGFLDLWRSDRRESFRDSDALLLAATAPTVTTALRECQARTFVEPATPQRTRAGPVVLTLDDELRIVARTAPTQQWLDVLLPPAPGESAVPASVYNVAAQLLAQEAGVDAHLASARTHLGDGFWLTLRAARMDSGAGSAGGAGSIVVSIEEASAAERLDLFARTFALSARENELLGLLATGADTRAMARSMALSEHTVQDHLKSIFAKTGARDRITVLSRALGTRHAPDPAPVGT